MAAIAGQGCDTVAEITFLNESFSSVTGLGFRPASPAACGAPGTEICLPPSCGRVDFVMETTTGSFLIPNMQLDHIEGRLTPGETFAVDDIQFSNAWIFQLDAAGLDVDCTGDASLCNPGFTCRTLDPLELPSNSYNACSSANCVDRCVAQASISASNLEYVALGNDPQPDNTRTRGLGYDGVSLALLIDNSASISSLADQTQATIPNLNHITQMQSFHQALFREARSGLIDDAELAIYELRGVGTSGVRSVFLDYPEFQGFGSSFLSDAETRGMSNQIFNQAITLLPSQVGLDEASRATPVWTGFYTVLQALYPTEAAASLTAGYARRILAFVDSPSDNGGDTSIDFGAVRDLIVAGLAPDVGGNIIHLDSLAPADDAGRSGPSSQYAELACLMGGQYMYDVWPESLDSHLQKAAVAYEGHWTMRVEIGLSDTSAGPANLGALEPGWYRVSNTMTVTVGEGVDAIDEVYPFGAILTGGTHTDGSLLYRDNRFLIEVEGGQQ